MSRIDDIFFFDMHVILTGMIRVCDTVRSCAAKKG